ncbi:MAG: nucleotidyltransferase family protein [Pseudomonadota bacterium]
MSTSSTELQQRLVSMAQESPWLMSALSAVRGLGLASWCIGAGAIRNLVWDTLHAFPTPSALPDIDVAYFDAADLSAERDADIQRRLSAAFPGLPWEVTNQAAVHLWFERSFGHAVPPLTSLHEAIASWPEYATAVGLTLRQDDTIEVIAPHGLEDLFSLTVRRNPARVSIDTYRQRIEQKRYSERWPRVKVIHC